MLSTQNKNETILDFIHIDLSHSACEVSSFSHIQAVPDHPFSGGGEGGADQELCLHTTTSQYSDLYYYLPGYRNDRQP